MKTKSELVSFCLANKVEVLNFHYTGFDGNIKTLNFVIRDEQHLLNILEAGERVDGSSLFPFIEAGRSDLYVVPVYSTAFLNPLEEVPTVDVMCTYFDRDGNPFEGSPRYILSKAVKALKESTGLEMHAMGELEYYVIGKDDGLYPVADQKGYHESKPYCKFADMRIEAMRAITAAGGKIKYGHSEVGNYTADGMIYEQNEIEFIPVPVEEAADQLVLAKWIIHQVAYRHGLTVSFAPKLADGKAGSGLHIHIKLARDGKSRMISGGEITDICRKAIAGLMDAGTSLPAFGNPSADSFRRLVPNQEAPTSLCWSFSNRSALVRVPLGWTGDVEMAAKCNPGEAPLGKDFSDKQTFEWRASDATADIYLLMAALCCAVRHGLEMPDALELNRRTFVDLGVNIHAAGNAAILNSLEQLPADTAEAAAELKKDRKIYTSEGVFTDALIDWQIHYLKVLKKEGCLTRIRPIPQAPLQRK